MGTDFAGPPAGWFSTTAGLAPAPTASLAVRCLLAALCLGFLDGAGLLLLPPMSSLGARILTRPFAAAATFPWVVGIASTGARRSCSALSPASGGDFVLLVELDPVAAVATAVI
jgi:hypothetical protein